MRVTPIHFLFVLLLAGYLSFFPEHVWAQEEISLSPYTTIMPSLISATPSPTPLPLSVDSLLSSESVPLSATDSAGLTADFCLDVPVLMYHHIEPLGIAEERGHAPLTVDRDVFEQHIAYLVSSGYHTISADALVTALLTHTQLPEKSVVLTLDDGYDDWYNYAFPIAQKYEVTLNLMVSSGLINNVTYMNWDQLKEMSQSPFVKIYNHTWSHTALGQVSKEKIASEIRAANNQLETNLGVQITILTYPYGSYNELAMETAKEQGIAAAFTTEDGRMHCQSNLLRLPRVRVGNAPLSDYGL